LTPDPAPATGEPCWMCALPEHRNLNHEDAKDAKVHEGGARRVAGVYRASRSQIIQKFFGSFFQKRTEESASFLKKRSRLRVVGKSDNLLEDMRWFEPSSSCALCASCFKFFLSVAIKIQSIPSFAIHRAIQTAVLATFVKGTAWRTSD
jgi:hypothetical protein